MRLRFAVLLIVTTNFPQPALGQESFPYKAFVTADDVYVRSGPGERYYPSGRLHAGAEVEVFRHDPGGWYAIRPPAGSFSWIGARYLRQGQDGLAEVIGERVAVRVGSELTDRRDVVQVRVQRGEVIEVLDRKPTGAGGSSAVWCKVAPPSGEFRWVHGDYVAKTHTPERAVEKASPPVSPVHAAKAAEPPPTKPAEPKAAPKWTPVAATATPSPSDTAIAAATTPASQTETRAIASAGSDAARGASSGVSRPLTDEEFQAELDDINSELSIMLAESPSRWKTEDLARRARMLEDRARTAVQQNQIRTLTGRIAQADEIKARYAAMASAAGGSPLSHRSRAAAAGGPLPTGASEERFDATGRLERVLPPKLGAPRYALTDERGNVLTYVNPAPGMNMQYYLGRRVGIYGVRGQLAEPNAEYVTAKHVTALDSQMR